MSKDRKVKGDGEEELEEITIGDAKADKGSTDSEVIPPHASDTEKRKFDDMTDGKRHLSDNKKKMKKDRNEKCEREEKPEGITFRDAKADKKSEKKKKSCKEKKEKDSERISEAEENGATNDDKKAKKKAKKEKKTGKPTE
ncbi:protein PXR1-like [Ischnura elegans]|uniref:protein PXR1-like n=1 Tax=Ischnura elegans TaxID=197161 RepID=UPI001ED8A739|nr:protein PXR1-like [Ischnura elegans]